MPSPPDTGLIAQLRRRVADLLTAPPPEADEPVDPVIDSRFRCKLCGTAQVASLRPHPTDDSLRAWATCGKCDPCGVWFWLDLNERGFTRVVLHPPRD